MADPPTAFALVQEPWMAHEPWIRLGAFALVLAAMAALEAWRPRRQRVRRRWQRWPSNLGVVVVDTLLVRLTFPIAAVGVAMWAEAQGWGLLNQLGLPWWLAVPLAVGLLDLAIWAQHLLFHHVPVLWRLHRVHHADIEIDVTTGIRFHPLEIVLSMAIKLAIVALLGAPALAVLIFEVLLNATSMFSHANLRLPGRLDRWLRLLLVTPDMHRVHHSVRREETNSNFGFNLPWWDRIFGTYRAQPREGHDGMTIGIDGFREHQEQRLDRMLTQPFRTPGAGPSQVPTGG